MSDHDNKDQESSDNEEVGKDSAIVIDYGSFSTLAGFAGYAEPYAIIPCYDRDKQFKPCTSLDDMKTLCASVIRRHLFQEPSEHPIFLADHPLNSASNREQITKYMFEQLHVPAFYVQTSSVLSLYAAGRTTGIVLESGYHSTYAVACYEGYPMPHAILRLNMGGYHLTLHMIKQLKYDAAYASMFGSSSDPSFSEQNAVRSMKEELCYVALDYETESKSLASLEKEYVLPDGQKLTVAEPRIEIAEILFEPTRIGVDEDGIQEVLRRAIHKCDVDIRDELWHNIVLSGGNSMFDGLDYRLTKELQNIAPKNCKIRVIAPPERAQSVWIGGSILTNLSTFEEMWIAKSEYDECGPSIVLRKCT